MGYVIVGCFSFCLGFSIFCWGLCYFIGFDSEDDMHKCTVTAIIILAINIILKITGICNSEYLYPF